MAAEKKAREKKMVKVTKSHQNQHMICEVFKEKIDGNKEGIFISSENCHFDAFKSNEKYIIYEKSSF